MRYENEHDFDKALWARIARRKQKSLSSPPYDDADVRVVLGGRNARKRKTTPNESMGKSRFPISSAFCVNNYQIAHIVREVLDIPNPIKVEDIPSILSKFEATQKEPISIEDMAKLKDIIGIDVNQNVLDATYARGDLVLPYPIARYTLSTNPSEWVRFNEPNAFPTYQIKQIQLNANEYPILIDFKWLLDQNSSEYGLNPALILAFYLCEEDIRDDITILLEDEHVTLALPSYTVTEKEIRLAYSQARELLKKPSTRRVGPSERVRKLYNFRKLNSRISWSEFLAKWNKKYPKWKYKDTASIQVVLSRVSKWINPKEQWTKDITNQILAYLDWRDISAKLYEDPDWAKLSEKERTRLVKGLKSDDGSMK